MNSQSQNVDNSHQNNLIPTRKTSEQKKTGPIWLENVSLFESLGQWVRIFCKLDSPSKSSLFVLEQSFPRTYFLFSHNTINSQSQNVDNSHQNNFIPTRKTPEQRKTGPIWLENVSLFESLGQNFLQTWQIFKMVSFCFFEKFSAMFFNPIINLNKMY